MAEKLTIRSERVDDIPLLLAQLGRMGVPPLLDEHFPTPGNWVGLSLGWVTVIWLPPILSQAEHRLNHVEPWAEPQLDTLRRCTEQHVHPLDLSDDHLAAVLEALSGDDRWRAFEAALTRQLLRVYDLQPERGRLDSPTASGYGSVTEDGLFQVGHSKDHRPDLPQVKGMLSALAPLGLPVATDILPGQRADDPLYVPAITRVREGVGERGLLYVGDCKMGALQTRAFLQAGGDSYRCPLSAIQRPPEVLEGYLAPLWMEQQPLTRITRVAASGKRACIAEGDEQLVPVTAEVAGAAITWTERRLVVRARLATAQAAVAALNERGRGKPRFTALPALQAVVEAILTQDRVQSLVAGRYTEGVQERPLRRDGHRPATGRIERDLRVMAVVDRRAVAVAVRRLGWRVYATNAPADQLSLAQAVLAYRSESLLERDMGRWKGQPLSLTPMDLERDDHVTGLIRVLVVGLRVLTLLEFVVRRRLAAEQPELAGLYVGNPTRATARPTAERLLEAFRGLTLTIIREGRRRRFHLPPLSRVQRRILTRLAFPTDIDTRLYVDSQQPP